MQLAISDRASALGGMLGEAKNCGRIFH